MSATNPEKTQSRAREVEQLIDAGLSLSTLRFMMNNPGPLYERYRREWVRRIATGEAQPVHGPPPSKAIYEANWARKAAMGCQHYLDGDA